MEDEVVGPVEKIEDDEGERKHDTAALVNLLSYLQINHEPFYF